MTRGKDCRTPLAKSKHRSSHLWKPGQSGNPLGAPRRPEIAILRKALQIVKKENGGIDFIVDFVRKSYMSKDYALALFKKLIPTEALITKTDKKLIVSFEGKLDEPAKQTVDVKDLNEET